MATVPAPRTWTVGELLTAAKLNTDLRDGLNFLLAPPMAKLARAATLSAANNGQKIPWDTETLDRDAGWASSPNPTRYTAQTAGWWSITSDGRWFASTTQFTRMFRVFKTGTDQGGSSTTVSPSTGLARNNVTMQVNLNVGDYIEIDAFQDSGGAFDLFSAQFSAVWTSIT